MVKPHTQSPAQQHVPFLIGGHWVTSRSGRSGPVYNPSTGKVIATVPFCTPEEVDRAVQTAAAAFPAWAETPIVERARVMFQFRERLAAHADELAGLVTREHGKTLAEARASVQRGIEMVEFACGIPSLFMGQTLANIARQVDCETIRHPLGVCVGITPFNFPVMVPLWMFPVAITCGNTFVLKPSEKVPLSAVRLGELLDRVGAARGRFQRRPRRRRVCRRPCCRTRWCVRSRSSARPTVARSIYETGTRHGKRVQAAGGAKNHLIIMPDADLDQAVGALQLSAFGCAGERCMAGSIAVPVGHVADSLVEKLCESAQAMEVGPTDGGDVGRHGPGHHPRAPGAGDRLSRYRAGEEGAEIALDGRAHPGRRERFRHRPERPGPRQPRDAGGARRDLRAGALGRSRR